jgi:hypothetical protein
MVVAQIMYLGSNFMVISSKTSEHIGNIIVWIQFTYICTNFTRNNFVREIVTNKMAAQSCEVMFDNFLIVLM